MKRKRQLGKYGLGLQWRRLAERILSVTKPCGGDVGAIAGDLNPEGEHILQWGFTWSLMQLDWNAPSRCFAATTMRWKVGLAARGR